MLKRPMCGPKAGGSVWKQMITRDIRRDNLEKARKVKADLKSREELNEKEKDAKSE